MMPLPKGGHQQSTNVRLLSTTHTNRSHPHLPAPLSPNADRVALPSLSGHYHVVHYRATSGMGQLTLFPRHFLPGLGWSTTERPSSRKGAYIATRPNETILS